MVRNVGFACRVGDAADEGPGWRVHFTYEPAALAPEPAELEQESCMA